METRRAQIQNFLYQPITSLGLATFRILFGLLMLASMIRFASKGWIDRFYVQPPFHFSYFGFEWVQPIGEWTYLIFILCGLSAIGVALGYRYRISSILFFISFTYIELMDKTTYLNHYYFVSLMSFLLIFLPANVRLSLDVLRKPKLREEEIPRWPVLAIQLLLGMVYFYAGLAKLNSDWIIHAMPLRIWLPGKEAIPLIGPWLKEDWVAYAFSWSGALYDLCIPFLLLLRRTRILAMMGVVFFHVMTWVLFNIGMFPWIMIVSSTIFLSPQWYEDRFADLQRLFPRLQRSSTHDTSVARSARPQRRIPLVLPIFFAIQLLLPWRYLLYPGELFWTEEGFRFSWRVMLMEKAGYANFKIVDGETGKRMYVDNDDFLTSFQEKQMSTQADFILEYAHYLGHQYEAKGVKNPEVYVENYVALNGRPSRLFVDPEVNLMEINPSLATRTWILEFDDEIHGL